MRGSSDIVKGAVLRKSIVYVIVLALVAIGIYGLKHMNKDEFPTFEIKQGLVAGIYPGASAREVESRLTEPLEKILFSFPEVKRENTTSVSKDGVCYIYVDVDVAPEQKSQTWSKIRLALNAQKMFLPAGVLAVAVLDDFSAVSSLLIALESSDKSWTEMKYYADRLSSRLQSIKELANVSVIGAQEEEIAVVLDQDRLAGYGISPASLMLEYQTSSLPLSGGTFRGGFVDVGGMVSGEQEVADMIVWSDPEGNSLRLRDIATIERRYKKPRSFVDYNGNTALVLSVEMRPDNNIVAFGEKVDKVLAEYSEELPDSVSYEQDAMLEPMSVAVHAMHRVDVAQTDTVVVYGLGTIGLLLVMFLLEKGITNVFAVGNKASQRDAVVSIGLPETHFCNCKEQNVREWLPEKTNHLNADVVFECVGKSETLSEVISLATAGGRICVVGNPHSDMNLDKQTYWKILRNQLMVTGTWNSSFFKSIFDADEYGFYEESVDWEYVLKKLEERRIEPQKLITHQFHIQDLETGFHIMRDKTEDYIKIMMSI